MSGLIEEDQGQTAGEDDSAKLRQELAERNDEVAELKSRLESTAASELDAELEKARNVIEEERARSEDYLSQLKYLQADFENYRKRIDREIKDIEDFSTSSLIRKLLPVLDDLELAASAAGKDAESKGLVEGVVMVQKNLATVLQAEGLRAIEAVGQPFDPELHEAVERVDGTTGTRDTVVGEIRKGYILKDKVLRPSLVRVESAVKNSGENNEHTS